MRPNISLGDSLAGLNAALGVVLGLYGRDKLKRHGLHQTGQVVDVAIYEAMMNIMEGVIPEYDRLKQARKKCLFYKRKKVFMIVMCIDSSTFRIYSDGDCAYEYVSMQRGQVCDHWW